MEQLRSSRDPVNTVRLQSTVELVVVLPVVVVAVVVVIVVAIATRS